MRHAVVSDPQINKHLASSLFYFPLLSIFRHNFKLIDNKTAFNFNHKLILTDISEPGFCM